MQRVKRIMSKQQIEFFEISQQQQSAIQDERDRAGESTWFTPPVVVKPALNSNRLSRDEMNLAEFPLSVLSTRVSPGKKTLEFEDSVLDKNGHPVKRQWIITAADKFGLPTALTIGALAPFGAAATVTGGAILGGALTTGAITGSIAQIYGSKVKGKQEPPIPA